MSCDALVTCIGGKQDYFVLLCKQMQPVSETLQSSKEAAVNPNVLKFHL